MKTKFTLTSPAASARMAADLFVAGVKAGDKKRIAALDRRLGGAVSRGIEKGGNCFVLDTMGRLPAKAVAVCVPRSSSPGELFRASSAALKASGGADTVAVDIAGLSSAPAVRAVMEGALLGSYGFTKYKGGTPSAPPRRVAVSSTLKAGAFNDAANRALAVASGVRICRDLVNEPPMSLTPAALAGFAEEMCAERGLECEVMLPEEMKKRKMGGILAVGGGSANAPRLIRMVYRPARARGRVAIVGKGITFDSGGLSLKPADAMRTMKMDMAGAAAVMGAMSALGAVEPGVEVHGIVASAENMTGSAAYRPDDIVTPMNGKTVEIINTDAEGRVVLADALSYAVKLGAREIVDLATLTGACVVALGAGTAGVMGNNRRVVEGVKTAAARVGERVWELPLADDLRKDIESDFADIKNAGGRWGGAITAALFLEHFVSQKPWAHLDIAGPAYLEKGNDWLPKGASGFGVRTVVEYLCAR